MPGNQYRQETKHALSYTMLTRPHKDWSLKTAVLSASIPKIDAQAVKILAPDTYNIYNDRRSLKVLDIYTTIREITNLSTEPRQKK